MRVILPTVEGAEVKVALKCKWWVNWSPERFVMAKGTGVAVQRQGLCGSDDMQKSERCRGR